MQKTRMTFCLASAACDISITAVLCYLLHGSRTGFRSYVSSALVERALAELFNSTDNLVNTLMIHAINRGVITRCSVVFFLVRYETVT